MHAKSRIALVTGASPGITETNAESPSKLGDKASVGQE